MKIRSILVPLVMLAVAGCRDDEGPEMTAEVRAQRETVYRQACVASRIAAEAEEDVQILEGLAGAQDGGLGQQTTGAAVTFSRAYLNHAELRAIAYAYLDSAVNHSATTADSARYIERAGAISIRRPQEGTVEANVLAAYQNNFVALLQDADHPCNWDIPF